MLEIININIFLRPEEAIIIISDATLKQREWETSTYMIKCYLNLSHASLSSGSGDGVEMAGCPVMTFGQRFEVYQDAWLFELVELSFGRQSRNGGPLSDNTQRRHFRIPRMQNSLRDRGILERCLLKLQLVTKLVFGNQIIFSNWVSNQISIW